MYYHVKIQLNEKDKKDYHTNLSELDISSIDEIIKDTVLPYLQEDEFLFDGRMLKKSDIRSVKIYETEQTSQVLMDIENNKNRSEEFFVPISKSSIVEYDRYSKDITKKILTNESKNIFKKNKSTHNKIYDKNKVFIVHGHNNEVKLEVARFIEKIGFEHGFLIGKLGRSNVCSLVKGNIETPSDISGVVYTSMDSGYWQVELAKEMKASGYVVDMNKII